MTNNILLDTFYKQVESKRTNIAIVEAENHFTYMDLDLISDKIAEIINDDNSMEENIGVMMNGSALYICALLGVLKANKTFIPIDPELPIGRKDYIVNSASVKKVLCEKKDDLFTGISQIQVSNLGVDVCPKDKKEYKRTNQHAYIMYTSGSTGDPKGVLINDIGLKNLVDGFENTFPKGINNFIFISSVSFDASIVEIFVPLLTGKTIYIPPKNYILNGKLLYDYLYSYNIEFIQSVPIILKNTFKGRERIPSIKMLLTEGDSISEELKDELLSKGYDLYNAYGPTEMTVCVSIGKCHIGEKVDLGTPLLNTFVDVINDNGQKCNDGEEGELIVWGKGISSGYINDDSRNKQFFLEDNICKYRTGDLVKRMGDKFYYIGRNDNQVKINGCRTNLSEIDKKVKSLIPAISDVVSVVDHSDTRIQIVMFYVGQIEEAEIYDIVKKYLPSYMLPKKFINIDKLPMLISGKVDKHELITMYLKIKQEEAVDTTSNQVIANDELWNFLSKVFNVPVLELWNNRDKEIRYFGVDSLIYVQAVTMIEENYNVEFDDANLDHTKIENFQSFVDIVENMIQEKTE